MQFAISAQNLWSFPVWDVCEGVGRRLGITINLWIFWDMYPIGLSNIGPAPTASRQTEFQCQRVAEDQCCDTRPAAVPAITGHLPWSDTFLLPSLILESFFLTRLSLYNISCFILSVQLYSFLSYCLFLYRICFPQHKNSLECFWSFTHLPDISGNFGQQEGDLAKLST